MADDNLGTFNFDVLDNKVLFDVLREQFHAHTGPAKEANIILNSEKSKGMW